MDKPMDFQRTRSAHGLVAAAALLAWQGKPRFCGRLGGWKNDGEMMENCLIMMVFRCNLSILSGGLVYSVKMETKGSIMGMKLVS